ncbi:MAG TPA: hypothetical protein VH165_01645 [Kofleriaceae bacterium]|nr:hypothetical protein [Kofleriaceae bacterium]
MKRRDVLKLGAAATAAAQLPLDAGCVVPRATTPPTPTTDADGGKAFLTKLDGQLAALDDADFVSRFTRAQLGREPTTAQQAVLDDKDAMFRRMLRTLLITQGFRDQEPATQLDPDVQARMFTHMDEVGATVFEISDMLGSLDASHRPKLRQQLKAQPDLPMALAEAIDAHASRAGVSAKRRLQLRQMMANATFRLRHGDPNTLIDEYVAKVERVKQNGTTDAQALDLAQKLGERAFWKYQHQLAQDAGPQPAAPTTPAPTTAAPTTAAPTTAAPTTATPTTPAPTTAVPTTAAPAVPQPPQMTSNPKPAAPERAPHPGDGALRAAGYLLGIGVVTFGASAALVDASAAFLVGATIGAVLFAIGLVTLIVGAIIYASAD